MEDKQVKQLLHTAPFGFAYHKIILNPAGKAIDYEFLEVNPTFEQLTGLKAADILNRPVTAVTPGLTSEDFDRIGFYGQVALTGQPLEFEQYSAPLDRWYKVHVCSPHPHYFSTTFVDITQEKTQSAELEGFFAVNLDLLCIADLEGNFIKTNPAWSKTLGYSPAELNGHRFLDFVHPDDLQSTREAMARLGEQEEVLNFVNRYRCQDGRYRFIEWRSHPQGKLIYAAARDITERKQAENALRESRQAYQQLIEQMPEVIYTDEIGGRWRYVSPNIETLCGYSAEKLRAEPSLWPSLIPANDRGRLAAEIEALADGDVLNTEYRVQTRERGLIWVRDHGIVKVDETTGQKLIQGIMAEITAQKELEAALQESEANFRAFFETMTDLIFVATPEGRIFFTNQAVERKLGYSAAELATMHVLEVHPAALRQEAEEIFAAMFQGEREVCPLPLARKDGTLLPVETRVWFGQWNGQHCIFGISKDLSAEQEAQQRFERLFRHNPALMALSVLPERRFTDVNDAFLKTLGYAKADVIGKTVAELGLFSDPEQQAAVAKKLQAAGRVVDVELQLRRKDGIILDGLFSGEIISSQGQECFLTVMIDISHRKRAEAAQAKLEARNRQLEKNESLGRMAGAIAHHFNNQLQVVLGRLEMARSTHLPPPETLNKNLAQAMLAGQRAAEMSSLMLVYLGQTPETLELLDLVETCARSLTSLREPMPPHITLNISWPDPGPIINANASRLEQLLAQMVTNAAESISDGPGAIRLTVTTVSSQEIPPVNRFPLDWQPQDQAYACLEVADTGVGIAAADIEKIFDPFFSTKFTGRGLGLAVGLGIMRSHFGGVTVESDPGRGSVFRCFFPVIAHHAPASPEPKGDVPELADPGGTVLLVDDDNLVREIVAEILTGLGFTVLTAAGGLEAVEMFRQRQAEIDCVLTDLTMPGMDGWATLTALRQLSPDIPVILNSGYDESQVMAGYHPDRPQAFLRKPYQLQQLNQAIRQVLSAAKRPTDNPLEKNYAQ